MLEPLVQFICDECGQVIQSPEDGYVEWLRDSQGRNHGFRIVHHGPVARELRGANASCYRYTNSPGRADLQLDAFLGNSGLVRALSLIHPGDIHSSNPNDCLVVNANEFATLLRRLNLPYYDEARQYFDQASEDGYIGDANEVLVYTASFLRSMIERYEDSDND